MPFMPHVQQTTKLKIPYFEDAADQNIPGRGTEKTQTALKNEIIRLLQQLGANVVTFVAGKYDDTATPREGYQIQFSLDQGAGRIDCAALPLRNYTAHKQDRALAQALYLVRDKLQALVYAYAYEPHSIPLLPYLIGAGNRTVTEYIAASGDYQPARAALPAGER